MSINDLRELSEGNPNLPPSKSRRKMVLVQHSLQIKYTLLTMFLVSLACFTVWWETYRSVSVMAVGALTVDPSLLNTLTRINELVLFKVILHVGFVGLFSFLISHYIAGPIFRLERGLKALEQGDFSQRIQLRKRDELKNV